MNLIVLAKNFPVILGPAQVILTDWVDVDPEFQNANIHIHVQSLTPTTGLTAGISLSVETSYDTVEDDTLGGTWPILTTGSNDVAVTSNLASFVRLRLAATELFPMFGILSVWLQLKRE